MDFSYNDEEQLLLDGVAQFGTSAVAPHAASWDSECRLPSSVISEASELGLLSLEADEASGGAALPFHVAIAAVRTLAASDLGVALVLGVHNAATAAIGAIADAEHRGSWSKACHHEGVLLAWVGDDAPAGSGRAPRARLLGGPGDYRLEGEAPAVLGASLAGAFVVAAKQADETLALVCVRRDVPGVEVDAPTPSLGVRAVGTATVRFTGVAVGPDVVWSLAAHAECERVTDRVRVIAAAAACGAGGAALDRAVDYAKEREQFGRPIGQFQGIQWRIADAAVGLERAWLLAQRAAWALSRDSAPSRALAAQAKLSAARAGVDAAHHALQIHGGYGYTREYPIERHLRDLRYVAVGLGTDEAMRATIGAEILGRHAE